MGLAGALRRLMRSEAPAFPRGTPAASASEYSTDAYRSLPAEFNDELRLPVEWWAARPEVAATYGSGGRAPTMMRGRLRLGRALEVDAGGRRWTGLTLDQINDPDVRAALQRLAGRSDPQPRFNTNKVAEQARAAGYDSVVFNNIRDDVLGGAEPSTVYAMLSPHNVRLPHARFQDLSSGDVLAATATGAPIGLAAALALAERESV